MNQMKLMSRHRSVKDIIQRLERKSSIDKVPTRGCGNTSSDSLTDEEDEKSVASIKTGNASTFFDTPVGSGVVKNRRQMIEERIKKSRTETEKILPTKSWKSVSCDSILAPKTLSSTYSFNEIIIETGGNKMSYNQKHDYIQSSSSNNSYASSNNSSAESASYSSQGQMKKEQRSMTYSSNSSASSGSAADEFGTTDSESVESSGTPVDKLPLDLSFININQYNPNMAQTSGVGVRQPLFDERSATSSASSSASSGSVSLVENSGSNAQQIEPEPIQEHQPEVQQESVQKVEQKEETKAEEGDFDFQAVKTKKSTIFAQISPIYEKELNDVAAAVANGAVSSNASSSGSVNHSATVSHNSSQHSLKSNRSESKLDLLENRSLEAKHDYPCSIDMFNQFETITDKVLQEIEEKEDNHSRRSKSSRGSRASRTSYVSEQNQSIIRAKSLDEEFVSYLSNHAPSRFGTSSFLTPKELAQHQHESSKMLMLGDYHHGHSHSHYGSTLDQSIMEVQNVTDLISTSDI
jgi:hypothetical protein